MRLIFFLIPLAAAALLTACPDPFAPQPPDLGPPPADCATRPPAKITLHKGHGEVDAGMYVTEGIQGGDHIWINVEAENLGPLVLVEAAVRDPKTNELLSDEGLQDVEYLDPAESDAGTSSVTVQGRLAVSPDRVIGKEVTLAAKVTDACPHEASGTLTGVVEGYDPNPEF